MRADAPLDVAVVGGGISGLAAAWRLQRAGVSWALLEAAPRWGGVIRSERVDGFLLEGGPDSILTQKPEGIALCREAGLGDRIVPTNPHQRLVFVVHRGQLHPLPEGMALTVPLRILPFLRSRLFSWPGKIRMGFDLVRPGRHDPGDESIASLIGRRFGREAVERLAEPLLAGIHAGDPDRLSILSTFPRFADVERKHGSLIRGLRRVARPPGNAPPPAAFVSLPGGLGELVDALVARLPAERLRGGTPVRGLRRDGDGFALETGGGIVRARAAVVALPAPAAEPLLRPSAPAASDELRAIPFASTATVLLGYRRADVAHPLDGYGLVVPRTEGLRTNACSFFSTKFPDRAPEGHVLLRGFLGGARDPGVLDRDDAALVDLLRRDLGPVLGLRGTPVLARVFRWPAGTPQMEVGHLERVAGIESELRRVPGLFLSGAGFRVTGIPDCVADGGRAAEAALAFVHAAVAGLRGG